MSKPSSAANVEAALNFLRSATPESAADLPATIDYPALAAHAASHGFETNADAIERAFRILMRMRNARLANAKTPGR